jgi:hypothetical protein
MEDITMCTSEYMYYVLSSLNKLLVTVKAIQCASVNCEHVLDLRHVAIGFHRGRINTSVHITYYGDADAHISNQFSIIPQCGEM